MRDFKQFSKRLLESISPHDARLNVLVRAGLLGEEQLPALRKTLSLDENVEENKVLLEFINNVVNVLLNSSEALQKTQRIVNEESNSCDDSFTKEELYKHFDVNGDGIVDMQDYASHIAFHQARPELLAQHMCDMDDVRNRHATGHFVDNELYNKYTKNAALVMTPTPEVTEGRQDHSKPIDPPSVLVLRRKLIRNFNNGQRVALYYSDVLKKFVTVPYSDFQWSAIHEETEVSDVMDALEYMINYESVNDESIITFNNGKSTTVDIHTAKKIVEVYNELGDDNRTKLIEMINSNETQFQKVVDFANTYAQ